MKLPAELLKFIEQSREGAKGKNGEEDVEAEEVAFDPKIHYDKEDLISFH